MRSVLLALILCFTFVPESIAAEGETLDKAVASATVTSSLDTNKDGKVDAAETKAAMEADADIGDLMTGAGEVSDAAKNLKKKKGDEPPMPLGMAIALLLGAIFKLLLSGIKVLGKNVAWFKSKDGKRVVKYSTLGLGAAAMITANLAGGMPWLEAAYLLLSGPLAIAMHEYTKDSKDTPAEA